MEYTIDTAPATLAARGKEGLIISKDYRGKQVLAAYRHLRVSPEVGWGMVTKMDEEYAFAHLQEMLRFTYWSGFVGVILVLCVVALISRTLSRPITKLSRTAKEVERGNLSARVRYTGSGEIGLLGRSFNSMAERIEHWHQTLEKQVEKRTKELESRNEQLKIEVTERKQAEEELRQFEHIVSSSTDMMALLGAKFDYIAVNVGLSGGIR